MSIKNYATFENLVNLFTSIGNKLKNKLSYFDNGKLGAKNLLPLTSMNSSYYVDGITWTVASDGTIIANGTADSSTDSRLTIKIPSNLSGNFYFSGTSDGGGSGTYDTYAWDNTTNARPKKWDGITEVESDYGEGSKEVQIQNGHDVRITLRVRKNITVNNLVFKPMVRLGSDADNTFRPYSMTNMELTNNKYNRSESNILGAKNLLPNNAKSSIVNGITYTVNEDGTILADGSTSFSSSTLKLSEITLKAGDRYIVSGGYNNKVRINIYRKANPSTEILVEDLDYIWQVPNNGIYVVQIYINTNTIVSNALLKPMLRLVYDIDNTYYPYAMTNKELTDNVAISDVNNGILGAKNLLPKSTKTTDSSNGIDFTFNNNGSVTFSGTASNTAEAYFDQTMDERLLVNNLPERLIINGCDSKDTEYGYGIEVVYRDVSNAYISNQICYVGDLELIIPSNAYYIRVAIIVKSGTVISSPITVYPMLRLATDRDDTYRQYALTNKELTDNINSLADVAKSGSYSDLSDTPELGSAAVLDVPSTGDAELDEVVLGNDSRLTNDRNPLSHSHEKSDITDLFDVINNLASTSTDDALSACQGKNLNDNKCDNSVIAPVETGTSASRAYSTGEHFIKDGGFCTAITNISSGATLSLNSNYISGQIDSKSILSSIVLTSSTNLNNLNSASNFGIYSWSSTSVPTNAPISSTASMIVMRYGAVSLQQVVFNGSSIYLRAYSTSSGEWSSWVEIKHNTFSVKTVTYENKSAVTIASNSSESIPLSLKSGDDITGYTFLGISSYNLDSGVAAIGLACKAINTGNIVIENLSSSSITIAKGAVIVSARYAKFA